MANIANKILLNKKERKELDLRIKSTRDSKIIKRFLCIRYLDNGMTKGEVIKLYKISYTTLSSWLKIYEFCFFMIRFL